MPLYAGARVHPQSTDRGVMADEDHAETASEVSTSSDESEVEEWRQLAHPELPEGLDIEVKLMQEFRFVIITFSWLCSRRQSTPWQEQHAEKSLTSSPCMPRCSTTTI